MSLGPNSTFNRLPLGKVFYRNRLHARDPDTSSSGVVVNSLANVPAVSSKRSVWLGFERRRAPRFIMTREDRHSKIKRNV
jgi:hypothetical protein